MSRATMISPGFIALIVTALYQAIMPAAIAQSAVSGSPGSTQSSPGAEGEADNPKPYILALQTAKKHGRNSASYIDALIDLGLYYNRRQNWQQARLYLTEALAIIDGGALKPTIGSVEEKAPTIVPDPKSGTVSATINKPPSPYESTLEQLLPALAEAEQNSNHSSQAAAQIRRLINLAENNRINRVPNLLSAYNLYSQILKGMHRDKEAAHYKEKAEQLNKSIVGL